MDKIRKAGTQDTGRIAEIEIFNYRLNFYPIFRTTDYFFSELQVLSRAEALCGDPDRLDEMYVYDDGVVKGFIAVGDREVHKLFVEPAFQGQHIGEKLLQYAVENHGANRLWVLEKNTRAIRFYERHGFRLTDTKKLEEDTTEYLIRMEH